MAPVGLRHSRHRRQLSVAARRGIFRWCSFERLRYWSVSTTYSVDSVRGGLAARVIGPLQVPHPIAGSGLKGCGALRATAREVESRYVAVPVALPYLRPGRNQGKDAQLRKW